MLGLRKGENEYTYAACTKQQAEELIRGLREIVPYVVIDCSSYIANDILSAVALMEADSVLQLASCDLKSVGYLSSQLPLLGELKWDKDKQYRDILTDKNRWLRRMFFCLIGMLAVISFLLIVDFINPTIGVLHT